jgi:hypothetical protein
MHRHVVGERLLMRLPSIRGEVPAQVERSYEAVETVDLEVRLLPPQGLGRYCLQVVRIDAATSERLQERGAVAERVVGDTRLWHNAFTDFLGDIGASAAGHPNPAQAGAQNAPTPTQDTRELTLVLAGHAEGRAISFPNAERNVLLDPVRDRDFERHLLPNSMERS